MNGLLVARAQGSYNAVSGLWPLLHMPSFEAVLGPKYDRWLVRTVAGLLLVNGLVQLSADGSADTLRQARRLGTGTAAALAAVDAWYAFRGTISKGYLLDVPVELGWIAAWLASRDSDR
jgi:hypothetical protein